MQIVLWLEKEIKGVSQMLDHTIRAINSTVCLWLTTLTSFTASSAPFYRLIHHAIEKKNTTTPLVREIVQCLELQIGQPRLITLIMFCFFLHEENKISYIGKTSLF